jgi:hypothetical protein
MGVYRFLSLLFNRDLTSERQHDAMRIACQTRPRFDEVEKRDLSEPRRLPTAGRLRSRLSSAAWSPCHSRQGCAQCLAFLALLGHGKLAEGWSGLPHLCFQWRP